jgi:type II secretory pathway predicted ATPase ExeA
VPEASRRSLEIVYHGLRTKPFRENTDPAFLWLGLPYREALNTLRTGVLQNAGVLLLTGEVGVGKTMLARALADRLAGEGVRVAKLGHAPAHPEEFRNVVARAFGAPAPLDPQDTHAKGFADLLRAAHALGDRGLLVVDEAQNLDAALLDAVADLVRMGREASGGTTNVLNVLLVAQPGIETMLKRRKRHDGGDFVSVRAHLGRLDVAQVGEYVAFRLRAAGADREIFSYDAIGEVAATSGGIPRLINQICDRTLIATSAWNGCMVSAGVVRGALRDVDPAAVSPGRRRLTGARARRIVYAACLVAVIGLGVYLYQAGRLDGVADRLARTTRGASSPAPVAPAAAPSEPAPRAATESPTAAESSSARATDASGESAAARGSGWRVNAPDANSANLGVPAATPPPVNGAPIERSSTARESAARESARESAARESTARGSAAREFAAPRAPAVSQRPALPRVVPAPRPDLGPVENAQLARPRPGSAQPAPATEPSPPVASRPSPPPAVIRPAPPIVSAPPPAREIAPEAAPPARSGRGDSSDDPGAIIDWLIQRNPKAGQ